MSKLVQRLYLLPVTSMRKYIDFSSVVNSPGFEAEHARLRGYAIRRIYRADGWPFQFKEKKESLLYQRLKEGKEEKEERVWGEKAKQTEHTEPEKKQSSDKPKRVSIDIDALLED